MWSEILWVKPRLQRGDAVKMEGDLFGRFQRVYKRFGHGLRTILKGAFLGLSIGFITKLLDPLKEVEERIKALGKKGQSTQDLAEKFGTDAGSLAEFQAIGQAMGLEESDVTEKLQKFADAIELAHKEVKNQNSEFSPSTQVVNQFANETDVVRAFKNFMKEDLKIPEAQRRINEKAVFGDEITGAARRLFEANFDTVRKEIGLPSKGSLGFAAQKAGNFELKKTGQDIGVEERAFVKQANQLNERMLGAFLLNAEHAKQIEAADNARIEQLKQFEKTAQDIKEQIRGTQMTVEKGLIKLDDFFQWSRKELGGSWLFRKKAKVKKD